MVRYHYRAAHSCCRTCGLRFWNGPDSHGSLKQRQRWNAALYDHLGAQGNAGRQPPPSNSFYFYCRVYIAALPLSASSHNLISRSRFPECLSDVSLVCAGCWGPPLPFKRVHLLALSVLFPPQLWSFSSGWPLLATSIAVLCLPECSFLSFFWHPLFDDILSCLFLLDGILAKYSFSLQTCLLPALCHICCLMCKPCVNGVFNLLCLPFIAHRDELYSCREVICGQACFDWSIKILDDDRKVSIDLIMVHQKILGIKHCWPVYKFNSFLFLDQSVSHNDKWISPCLDL